MVHSCVCAWLISLTSEKRLAQSPVHRLLDGQILDTIRIAYDCVHLDYEA